jgi:hypothetical protein
MRWQWRASAGVAVDAGVGIGGACITLSAIPCTVSEAPGTI